jgi:hypothetical protein
MVTQPSNPECEKPVSKFAFECNLCPHVQADLCQRLHKLGTVDLDDVRDARKRFDKTSGDYERARWGSAG